MVAKWTCNGKFHHATYRDQGTCWEGLWVYEAAEDGFRGYKPTGAFFKGDPNLDAAYAEVSNTGVSVGAFGRG